MAIQPEVILFDEPCSALDPISTAKVEELIDELRRDYTIAIVTHNMQQAVRVSQYTAFMYLGEMVEFGQTDNVFTAPVRTPHPGLHHRPFRLRRHNAYILRRVRPVSSKGPRPSDRTVNMVDHTVKSFDSDLEALDRHIAEMGGIAEKMLADAMDALAGMNSDLAQKVIAADPRLDALQREIEDLAIRTIARRQPLAIDLREIVGAIRISADLERIGDLAKNIAKRATKIAGESRIPRAVVGLKSMHDVAAMQLNDVLDAYAQRDPERAKAVWTRDVELDALEDSVFRDLLTFMMEDPRNITFCTHLLFCSKNLERVGDHTTNIAETVVYIMTGELLPMERPRGIDSTTLP